ncbi:cobalamin biosynthesis protein CobD [Vallitalea longa]|uniref:Cobalamin biosynthesis protein CobD n=1 Tax=Vallitalea longa TaxID=2936439 RepID=A0A9W6DGW6_9FIRM|nr:adenosylcobinamide-phosphate synthase CbiB [Vallitalea longa]GKX32055.1 cobalamin biosynthesis protein CobD [Vallitalea longa]
MKPIIILCIAILLDRIFGDPVNIPHPIIYIGKLISRLEKTIRKSRIPLKIGGFVLLITTVGITFFSITLVLFVCSKIHPYIQDIVTTYLLYTALAAKCLKDEVLKVYKAIEKDDLELSRKQLSYLVGRDTNNLTKEEIIRGAIETAAENTVDGVLAPLMFIAIGFIVNMPVQFVFMYKAVNTLDSMVGYLHVKYKDIGFASAKTDDIFNYIPARLGSFFMLLAGGVLRYDFKKGLKILRRDNKNHKSPNCGYPESVVAGLLNIQIGGTNTYFDEVVVKPTIGDPGEKLNGKHIVKSTSVIYVSEIITLVVICLIMFSISFI